MQRRAQGEFPQFEEAKGEVIGVPETESLLQEVPSEIIHETPESQAAREEAERREIENVEREIQAIQENDFDKMKESEIAIQREKVSEVEKSSEKPVTKLDTARAFLSSLSRVLFPRQLSEVKSSVIGLSLFEKDKVTKLELPDGLKLDAGDKFARMHLSLERWKPGRPEVMEDFRWVLDELANKFANDREFRDIKAVNCISLLLGDSRNEQMLRDVGFQVNKIKNPVKRAYHGTVGWLTYLAARGPRAAFKRQVNVREGWLSRDALLRYQREHPVV